MSTEENRTPAPFAVHILQHPHSTLARPEERRLGHALQDVYDIATNSLDFGSGFLSTEELENLRILGKAIGAPPLHYAECREREAFVVEYPYQITAEYPMGSTVPARPCTCGAYTFDVETVDADRPTPELPA